MQGEGVGVQDLVKGAAERKEASRDKQDQDAPQARQNLWGVGLGVWFEGVGCRV